MYGWLIALGLLVAYVLFLFWVVQTGRLQRWNMALMLGFVLMVRTQRGKRALDVLARPKRLWNLYADLGILVSLSGMLLITLFFFFSVWFSLQPDSGVPELSAREILVIPGVNPFVPLWYGLIALVITLVVHEGGHGILARANGLRVKSLGLLVAVVPIGAFVEPDEEDMRAAGRRRRLRVFAAGPVVNLSVAFLFMAALAAAMSGVQAHGGAHLAAVVKDAPAAEAGLEAGDTIVAFDGEPVGSWQDFQGHMERRHPGDHVRLGLRQGGADREVTLGMAWEAVPEDDQARVLQDDPEAIETYCSSLDAYSDGHDCAEQLQRQARMGVRAFLPESGRFLTDPFGAGWLGFSLLVSLPIMEVLSDQPFLSLYMPSFYDAPGPDAVFWGAVALLFWVFWINLMVGITNILPMLPLDGGHIFRDAAGAVLDRVAPSMEERRRDRVIGWTAGAMSLLILFAFFAQFLGPRLV